jgi:hypothetical protein
VTCGHQHQTPYKQQLSNAPPTLKPPANKATFPTDTAASSVRATLSWVVDQVHMPCARTEIKVQLIATKKIVGNSLRVPGNLHEAIFAKAGTRMKGLEEKADILIN